MILAPGTRRHSVAGTGCAPASSAEPTPPPEGSVRPPGAPPGAVRPRGDQDRGGRTGAAWLRSTRRLSTVRQGVRPSWRTGGPGGGAPGQAAGDR
ncbi:MAG: hypothetical protein ACREQ5_32575 [Candidatus Dormibacteria bacterium]